MQQETLSKLKDLRKSNKSYREILTELNSAGLKTNTGRPFTRNTLTYYFRKLNHDKDKTDIPRVVIKPTTKWDVMIAIGRCEEMNQQQKLKLMAFFLKETL